MPLQADNGSCASGPRKRAHEMSSFISALGGDGHSSSDVLLPNQIPAQESFVGYIQTGGGDALPTVAIHCTVKN